MTKLFNDFFPIVLFFVAYKVWGIYVATSVAIGISALQLTYSYIRHKKLDSLQLLTLFLLVFLGGATLWLHDEIFIKWKPSIINWLLGAIFFLSPYFNSRRQPFLQQLMQSQIALPKATWKNLNLSWVGFFIAMGFANLYVIYHFNTNAWVNFKLFGMLGLTILFVIVQSFYLAKHVKTYKNT